MSGRGDARGDALRPGRAGPILPDAPWIRWAKIRTSVALESAPAALAA